MKCRAMNYSQLNMATTFKCYQQPIKPWVEVRIFFEPHLFEAVDIYAIACLKNRLAKGQSMSTILSLHTTKHGCDVFRCHQHSK